jgi:hypothetical protein
MLCPLSSSRCMARRPPLSESPIGSDAGVVGGQLKKLYGIREKAEDTGHNPRQSAVAE